MKVKYRRIYMWALSSIIIVVGVGGYLYKDIPLRTAVFRSFAKGNMYLISEQDTLYGFGYYGVKKFLVMNSGNTKVLSENDDFCENCFVGHLVGRSGVVNGKYLYVVCRSYLGGDDIANGKGYQNGKLIVLGKNNLCIIKELSSDIKLIEAKLYKNNLVVSGLKGFNIYDVTHPESPKLIFRYRQETFTEFQGLEIFNHNNATYIVFARFADGISIWDMTQPTYTHHVKDISIQDFLMNSTIMSKGLQCFRVVMNYPYLYASLAPMTDHIGTENDYRGVLTLNLSDINNVETKATLIPTKKFYSAKIGDPEPSHLAIYGRKLYANFCEKGIAVFDINNPASPQYEKIINISDNNNVILPIHINHKGILFAGDYYWSDIYNYNLSE